MDRTLKSYGCHTERGSRIDISGRDPINATHGQILLSTTSTNKVSIIYDTGRYVKSTIEDYGPVLRFFDRHPELVREMNRNGWRLISTSCWAQCLIAGRYKKSSNSNELLLVARGEVAAVNIGGAVSVEYHNATHTSNRPRAGHHGRRRRRSGGRGRHFARALRPHAPSHLRLSRRPTCPNATPGSGRFARWSRTRSF